jgi:UDP-N-acetylmuramate: L-alanyl-gamma-D-glutamyl-meso-diaminopimelate ligase
MRIHFIAIGGAAMHNLAIALHQKGYRVTGSDDEIFEPSRSRLEKYRLLPSKQGWDATVITNDLDAVILGMHALGDNPEMIKAKELGIPVYSYPEYLYEQTKDKTRVVIGGSHGKTTITAMVLHVLRYHGKTFDFMVGAQLEGFDTMVSLSVSAQLAVFEGDEYLSSPMDPRPKFHLYKPHIALLSGIAWDHVNVFPTFEIYKEQFRLFIESIADGGTLIYYRGDEEIESLVRQTTKKLTFIPYREHPAVTVEGITYLIHNNERIPLKIFGIHNLQNMNGARLVCNQLGLTDEAFYEAITSFEGAAKRLQLLGGNSSTQIYLDFAHSPSKLKATVNAVKTQFPGKELIACMELHTFSSLKKEFLAQYRGTMDMADLPVVFFNPEVIHHKQLDELDEDFVKKAFDNKKLCVFTKKNEIEDFLKSRDLKNKIVLFMSSGNFSGIDFKQLTTLLLK